MTRKATEKIIHVKRAYEKPEAADGTRILVDRLWPRGVKKEAAKIHVWAKDIAPSTALRKWFGHDPARFAEFRRRYTAELRAHTEKLDKMRELSLLGPITLIFAARDQEHNEAVIIRDVLTG